MNLTIDIGNTLTKFAAFQDDQMVKLWCGPFKDATRALAEEINNDRPEAAILSTVQHKQGEVPESLQFLKQEGIRLITARPGMALPVTIRYATPETLGTDRIAAAVAGHVFSPCEAVLVINAGTCLTTDLVTAKGEYLGGTIAPGFRMRLQAMHHFTGNLPLIDPYANPHPPCKNPAVISPSSGSAPETSNHLPGSNTHEAMLLGVKAGMIAEVDGLIEQYRQDIGFFNIILSGGDIKIFDKKLKNRIFAVENIVMHGLNQMLIHNV